MQGNSRYSSYFNEVLDAPPSWVVRSGAYLIFFILIFLLALTWFIKYSDSISGDLRLVSNNPDKQLISNISGRLRLKVNNGEFVQRDQILAGIHDDNVIDNVLFLTEFLRINEEESAENVVFPTHVKIGSLQVSYSQLITSHLNFLNVVNHNKYFKQIERLKKELGVVKRQQENDLLNLKYGENKVQIEKQNLDMNEALFKSDVISRQKINELRSNYIDEINQLQNLKSNLLQLELREVNINGNIESIQLEREQDSLRLINAYQRNYEALISEIEEWKRIHLLVSPEKGFVTINEIWANNQYVDMGANILTITPEASSIFAIVKIGASNSSLVKVGQEVNIKLDAYPSNEYGYIIGEVEHISSYMFEGGYSVQVKLPNGLKTNNGIELSYKSETSGSAEIITEKKRFISKLFGRYQNAISSIK